MVNIDLCGKKALVTGGSQGIGAEICKKLASCGADVFINYFKNEAKAQQLAKELEKEYGVKAVCGGANVADAAQVKNMFLLFDDTLGAIDILVNNAGSESVLHVLDMEEKEWDRVLDINLKGPFLCSKEAGRRMEKRGEELLSTSPLYMIPFPERD